MKTKKIISILLVVLLSVNFWGCQKVIDSKEISKADNEIECYACGQKNSIENSFCSACGCGIRADNGNSGNFYDEESEIYEEEIQNFSLLSYFRSVSDKPLIIYECEISKSAEVDTVYVMKNGRCRQYYCSTTLGELSKMTDKQILKMLEDEYQDGLEEALSIWKSEYNTKKAISEGKVKLYEPRSYDIEGCLFTDDTGNSVVGELLFFPVAGVGGSPYVIEYDEYSAPKERFMNYYGTYKDSSSYRDIKFDCEYFNTGYGTQSDVNQINNMYYITSRSMKSGTVYNSHYYGLKSMDNEWVRGKDRTLCFRVDDPGYFNLRLDTLSSSDVSFVDPTEKNILQISNTYYNQYYSSFETLK